jgi:uncharacterized protein
MAMEPGRFGRTLSLRIRPNEDLTRGVEKACAEYGIAHAIVRTGIGSLIDGCLCYGPERTEKKLHGPVVEIITLGGEVMSGRDGKPEARLFGLIGGPDGAVSGGNFVPDRNTVLVTAEVVLQEWQPTA